MTAGNRYWEPENEQSAPLDLTPEEVQCPATEERLRENAKPEEVLIRPGAVVQLKSGGPLMTVERIRQDDDGVSYARCVWWTGRDYGCTDLSLDALRTVEGEPRLVGIANKVLRANKLA